MIWKNQHGDTIEIEERGQEDVLWIELTDDQDVVEMSIGKEAVAEIVEYLMRWLQHA